MTMPTATTIAGCFSLAAFAVAVLAGLAGGNPASSILLRAIVALLVCYPLGLAVGLVAQRTVSEQAEEHRQANPAPDSDISAPMGEAPQSGDNDEEAIAA